MKRLKFKDVLLIFAVLIAAGLLVQKIRSESQPEREYSTTLGMVVYETTDSARYVTKLNELEDSDCEIIDISICQDIGIDHYYITYQNPPRFEYLGEPKDGCFVVYDRQTGNQSTISGDGMEVIEWNGKQYVVTP